MPIYTFFCEKCDKDFELIVPLYTEKQPCPVCEKEMKRIWDASHQAVIFKGSGWTEISGRKG